MRITKAIHPFQTIALLHKRLSDRPDYKTTIMQTKTMLVIIDSGIDNPQQLAQGVLAEAHVALLKPDQDGIAQITALLQQHADITSLHIISHGSPGAVYLGNSQLSLSTLNHYASMLQAWSVPQLLFYGCNVAAGDAGSEFIEKLQHFTGATIAASSTPVGNAVLGGTWHLDTTTNAQPVTLAIKPEVVSTYRGIFAALPDVGTIFSINGSASQISSSEIRLTSDTNDQSGQAYSKARIDFNYNWDFTFDLYLGTSDSGADGIGFVLHNDPAGSSATGSTGEGLGIAGVQNSIGIEFDTYQNTGEVVDDHTSILDPQTNTFLTGITSLPDIEDNSYHRVVVSWNTSSQTLAYTLDGTPIQSITRNLVSLDFGTNLIYWGFGAATGGATNEHRIKVFDFNGRLVDQGGNDIINTALPAPDLTASSDTGLLNTDNVTSDNTPTFTGTADPNATVMLTSSVNGVVGTTTADGSGNYTITASTLGAGSHNMTVTSTVGGNTSAPSPALAITIDTTTPLAPSVVPDLAALSDTGVSDSDNLTNDTTPTFTGAPGSGTVGDTVTLYNGNTAIGTGIVAANGSWSVTTSALSADTYNVSASFTDTAGNESAKSPTLEVTISTTPPAAPGAAPDLVALSDTGISDSDNLTNDTTPTFTGAPGSGTDGDIVTLYDGNTVIGTGTVEADGSWSVTTSALSADTYNVSASFTDTAGNESAKSPTLEVTISTTPPAAPASAPDLAALSDAGVSNTDNLTSDTTPTFNGAPGSGTDGDIVTLYDGNTVIGTGTVAADGSWSVTSSVLNSGDKTITFTLTDAAGNESSPSPSLSITIEGEPVEPTPPVLGGGGGGSDNGNDGLTNNNKPAIGGTVTPGSTVEVLANGEPIQGIANINPDGTWSFTPANALPDGTYQLVVRATTPGGGTVDSPASTLTIDTLPATVEILDFGANVRDTSVDAINFRFSELVNNVDLSDLELSLNGQSVDLTNARLSTQDNQIFTLENIPGFTANSGNYQISVKPSGSITDRAGNALTVGGSSSWLTGYTADAFAPQTFRGGKPGVKNFGSSESNAFRGSRLNDVMRGGGGNDKVQGRGGNDNVSGGGGKDNLTGGLGKDRVRGQGGRDRLLGRQGKDLLLGGGGNDRILAGGGDDVIVGGAGNDLLTGGRGSDTFKYNSVNEGTDTITDFNASVDLIDLRSIFNDSRFAGSNRFAQFNEFVELVQVGSTVEVRIDADGSGSGTALNTLAVLNNQSTSAVTSRSFIVG